MRARALALAVLLIGLAAAPARAQQGGGAAADEDSQIFVDEAKAAMAKQQYEKAGRLLDKALELNPRRIDAYVLRATVHAIRKEYARGIAVLRRARALAPDNALVLTMLGTQLLLAGEAAEAVPLLEGVVKRWPDRHDAWLVLGHHYERSGGFADAIRCLEQYFRTRPKSLEREDPQHRLALANAHLRAGDPATARDLYQQVLAKQPKSVLGRLGLAWSTAAIDCAEAMPLLSGLDDLAVSYPSVHLVHGRCAMLLGKHDEALALAQRYSKARPDAPEGFALVGEAKLAAGDLKGARAAFEQAMALAPGSPLYAMLMARAERLDGAPEKAAERLRATGAPPGYESDWTVELAEALLATGRAGEALELLAPLVAAPDTEVSPAAVVLYGIALVETGDGAAAIPHLQRGLALDPSSTRAREPLVTALNDAGVAAYRAGDLALAEQQFARAAEIAEDAVSLRNLGAVLLARGRAEAAVAALERAARKDAKEVSVQHLLGRAHAAAGNVKKAIAALRQAIKLTGKELARQVDLRIDLASIQLAAGEPQRAVDDLEPLLALTGADKATRARVQEAWFTAGRAAATDWMRRGGFARAAALLEAMEKRLPKKGADELALAIQCDLALAATGAGHRDQALKRLRALEKRQASCPFVAPADKLAVPILIAWNEGSVLKRADAALKRLAAIRKAATGLARPLAQAAARSIAHAAAAEQFARGQLAKAKAYLVTARKWEDGASPETRHNLAVITLEEGDVDAAIAALEPLEAQVPEALVNLGLAWERKGQPAKALAYYKRALAAGVAFAPLEGWVRMGEQLWGGK